MKKIICKKEYDTEKSEIVKKCTFGYFGSPDGYEETLYVTESGNYVIEISARGYSAQNPYAPADQKKPIVIKVSVTAEGKIIDCLTVSQSESKNFGDACADEKFYGQFDGKTETDYGTIDAISGATVTTNAYKNAILTVFDTVKILQEVTE